MIADDPYRREYRHAGDGWLWVALASPFLGGVVLVVGIALEDGVPIIVPLAVGAALAALFLFVVRLVTVTATISDRTHLTVRGPFRDRATAWPDVQGIEIEENQGEAPGKVAVLYDAAGRRRTLPHLNDRGTVDLPREVAALREVWALHRGEDWAPVPKVADAIARTRRHPTPLVHIAFKAMMGAAMAGTVLFLIALATGMYAKNDAHAFVAMMAHPLALLMVLPLAAFIGAFAIGTLRRR
ncbi:hypothetical protein [Actinomadura sp. 21ATH]|uniref:hypothetical protein n=1 Tax=Actinomadura sp. 21ATH TaxID=1735444 RepID=UPI0035C12DBE